MNQTDDRFNQQNGQQNSWQDPSNPYNPYNTADTGTNGQYGGASGYGRQGPYQGGYNPYGQPPYQNGYGPYNRPPYYGGYYSAPYYRPPVWNDPMAAERKKKRKEIRKEANWIGAALLFMSLFGAFVAILFEAIYSILGFDSSGFFENSLLYAVFSPISVFLPCFIAAKATKHKLYELVPFERHSPALGAGVVMLGFAGVVIGNVFTDIVVTVFPAVGNAYNAAQTAQPTTLVEYGVELLCTAAIPALVEEIAFRGILLQMLRPWGDRFAIIISACAFALAHGNFVQIPVTFVVGLFMGYAVVRTGNLWTGVALHFLNNAMSVGLSALISAYPFLSNIGFSFIIYVVWALIGLCGFFIVKKKNGADGANTGMKKYTGCLSAGSRVGAVLSSATVIISLVYYIGSAFVMLASY